MSIRHHSSGRARDGAVMVIVLGLITIMLGLALGLTVRVYMGTKGGVIMQQNAQAWIMMQAARMMVDRGVAVPVAGATGGDITAIPGKDMSDRLGWLRITPDGAAFKVIASGGSSAQGGGKTSANDGDATRNAMEIRYYYRLSAAPASATLQPAQTDHYGDQW